MAAVRRWRETGPAVAWAPAATSGAPLTLLGRRGDVVAPIGIVLMGVAMRRSSVFGRGISNAAIAIGGIGVIGALGEIVDPGSDLSAVAMMAIVLFHLAAGWRTLRRTP